jgi:pyruvate/2-oxoacid:ferredoxin oxidoreductase beta subunit
MEARGDFETQVIAWAGDGATFDIGFSALSAAAQRDENILYVCYDNEAYMNTGNQQSGSTPGGSRTSTTAGAQDDGRRDKDLLWIMMGHGIPYAATATIAYPDDLMAKARKAKETKGFRLLHILTPCVPGWQYPSNQTVKLSRLAVQTRLFPLLELENGTCLTITNKGKPKRLEEYVRLQGRFKGLAAQDIERIQAAVDKRWRRLNWMSQWSDEN